MKRLAPFLLGLACTLPAWGATYYVTPTGAGATNGTSLSNAFAGWADIPGNTFSAGDVLCVVGELNSDTTMKFTDAGSAGNPVIIAGDCPEGAGILDGNNLAAPVLQLGDAGLAASYVRLRGLTVRDSGNGECILDSSLGAGGGYNEFVNLVVTDCLSNLTSQKPNPTVDGGTYSYCGSDCIGFNSLAVNPTVRNVTLEYISTTTTHGDGVAIYDQNGPSTILIENNTCYWDFSDKEKQCFIIGTASGTVTIQDNRFIARVYAVNNHAIGVTAATDAYVLRNYCDGFKACVTHFNSSAEGIDGAMYVRSNIAKGSQYAVLFTPSVGTPSLYADNNSGAQLVNGLRATSTVLANLYVRNNVFALDGTGGNALYVGNSYNTYTGSGNTFTPEGATYVENYECGGTTYNTAATYVAACTQEVGTNSSAPAFLGGPSPTTAEGFRPRADSPLCGAGIHVGKLYDKAGRKYRTPPSIGAFECRGGRAPISSRRAASVRVSR